MSLADLAESATPGKPLYQLVREELRRDLQNGHYQEGDVVPPEPVLCTTYGVSRVTVRRAVADLVEEGVLERLPGKGTFVRESAFTAPGMVSMSGFGSTAERFRVGPRRRVLRMQETRAEARVASLLEVQTGCPLYRLERVLLDGDAPLALDTTHYPIHRFPGLLDHIRDDVSTFAILRSQYNTRLEEASGTLRVGVADTDQAHLLGIGVNESVLVVEKVVKDPDAAPVLLSDLTVNSRLVRLAFNSHL